MKNIIFFAIFLVLTACATVPLSPKKPYESRRVPVNKTLPIEIDGSRYDQQSKAY